MTEDCFIAGAADRISVGVIHWLRFNANIKTLFLWLEDDFIPNEAAIHFALITL